MSSDRSGKHISERGSLLILTSIFMTVMLSFGLITVNVVTEEVMDTKTVSSAIQAEYIAEAGLERAMRELKNTWNATQDWSDVLDGPDDTTSTSDDGELSFGRPVSFNGGNYSVVVTDNDDGDSDLFTDSDDTVVITSVGTASDGTVKTVIAEIDAISLNPNGAVYLHGTSSQVSFWIGDTFLVSGDDYNIGEITPSVLGTVHGFTTNASTLTVADQYKDNIQGKDYDSLPDPDVPSILPLAPSADPQALISLYSPYADEVLTGWLYFRNFGDSMNYKIIYATGDILLIGNYQGYGLLLVEGSVTIIGNYRWNGIIIAGNNAFFADSSSDAELYGAMYVGDAGGENATLTLLGAASLLYSKEAIRGTNTRLPLKINYWAIQ